MVEATFIASGETSTEALQMAASLSLKVLLGTDNFVRSRKLDVFCDNIKDANELNAILWDMPKYSVIDHGLVGQEENTLVQIGYPGTKFSLKSDYIINVSPDLPKNLDTYKSYIQLVIMDDSILRERAADTWTQCKKLGLDAKFLKSL